MISVKITALENSRVNPEFIGKLGIPRTVGNFLFEWHQSWGTWIRNKSTYENYIKWLSGTADVERWGKLHGSSIVIFDLCLSITLDSVQKGNLDNWLDSSSINIKEHIDEESAGLFAIATALQNKNWHGILLVASVKGDANNFDPAIQILRERFLRDDVQVVIDGHALAAVHLGIVKGIVDNGI